MKKFSIIIKSDCFEEYEIEACEENWQRAKEHIEV
jgi:hypothetical protein